MALTYDSTTGVRALLGGNLISDIDTGFLSMAQDVANQRHAIQAGVIDSGSFMVTQRAAGATMTVDVASNSGRGAYATDASSRLVFVPANGSATNVAVTSNASGNPRIDIVTVSTAGVVVVTAGTATSGATLNNRTGAASTPSGSLLLADILVANGAASITNTVIRDRRPWARGAYCRITSSTVYTRSAGTFALIDGTNLQPRVECSGVPLTVRLLAGQFIANAADVLLDFDLFVDGATAGQHSTFMLPHVAAGGVPAGLLWEFVPAAGSHLFGPAWVSDNATSTIQIGGGSGGFGTLMPVTLIVQEQVTQNAANNTSTSG